jgi:hypothetical protein
MRKTFVVPASVLAVVLVAALAAFFITKAVHKRHAQTQERPIPRLVKKDGRFALMVDDAPYLVLGTEVSNSDAWPETLAKLWPALEAVQVNTVEIPIYWEQFEPQPGQYDYSLIDTILAGARQHNLRLVLLWFGTYKNGSQHYIPEWMKLDPARYFYAQDSNGQEVDSPSPFATASLDADKKAYAAFMEHLKQTDPQRTVIMIQVENEAGNWKSVRDFSPAAQKFFEAPVPTEVLKAMPPLKTSASPNWRQAYGPNADEYFNAWAVAKFVGDVASAGKAVYPLPTDVNVALRYPFHPGPPGHPGAVLAYESGAATDNVIPIWKVAAPAIDMIAPDMDNFGPDMDVHANDKLQTDPVAYEYELGLYRRDDNPLFVAETGDTGNARFLFSALNLQAIGFCPFGTAESSPDQVDAWTKDFRLLEPMQRQIARLNFEGKLQAVAEQQGKPTVTLPFGTWNALVSYGTSRTGPATGNPTPVGRALVARLGDNQFLVTGYYARVDFFPAGTEQQQKSQHIVDGTGQTPSALIDGKWQHRQFLRVEEGTYENGVFKFLRILNGSPTDHGLRFSGEPMVLRVSLATY